MPLQRLGGNQIGNPLPYGQHLMEQDVRIELNTVTRRCVGNALMTPVIFNLHFNNFANNKLILRVCTC